MHVDLSSHDQSVLDQLSNIFACITVIIKILIGREEEHTTRHSTKQMQEWSGLSAWKQPSQSENMILTGVGKLDLISLVGVNPNLVLSTLHH